MKGFSLNVLQKPLLSKALGALEQEVKEAAAGAVYTEGEKEMTLSKYEVPVATGALRASGHVDPPETSGNVITVRMGYGGPATDYALIVHEDLTAVHPVGKAKYLEDVVTERVNSGAAEADIEKDIKKRLTGFGT